MPKTEAEATATGKPEKPARKSKYIPWAELLRRTFGFEIVCQKCHSPLRLIALVKNQDVAARILTAMHLPTGVPELHPARPPPASERAARDAEDWPEMAIEGAHRGQSGAVTVVQRTSADLKLHPHLHLIALDGVFVAGPDGKPAFHSLPRISDTAVADLPASGQSSSRQSSCLKWPRPRPSIGMARPGVNASGVSPLMSMAPTAPKT